MDKCLSEMGLFTGQNEPLFVGDLKKTLQKSRNTCEKFHLLQVKNLSTYTIIEYRNILNYREPYPA